MAQKVISKAGKACGQHVGQTFKKIQLLKLFGFLGLDFKLSYSFGASVIFPVAIFGVQDL